MAALSPGIEPKFLRPKILVIDAPDVAPALKERGYAAASGTFGQPMAVPTTGGYFPVTMSLDDLPGHTEQEIVVADLSAPVARQFDGQPPERPGPGVPRIWAPLSRGLVDPRPAVMWGVRDDMDRIYRHGGIFILFAAPRFNPGLIIASLDSYGEIAHGAQDLGANNWSLLSQLQYLPVKDDSGEEMDVAPGDVARTLGIENYFSAGRFTCVMRPTDPVAFRWSTLATSKYGDPVAGIIYPDREEIKGWIFVFPQVERRAELVLDLVDRVLPQLAPRLFPHAEGSQWTRRPEYDLPRVGQLREEIIQIEQDARTQIREREELIEAERAQYGYLHDLLTGTGESLVEAVVSALNMIGFNDVRNVDADADAAGQAGPRREDIQIMDTPKPVLVEVKGITGTPKEASSLQVTKYLIPRMREWDQTDLHGLAIINHQRHLPALDREHEHVFQNDVLSNAEEQGFGLLTTWDLFRLIRGYLANSWKHDDIVDLFVSSGRIRPLPAHYKFIGTVDEYWAKASAIGVRLHSNSLNIGDRVAYELPIDFVEETITSLHLNDQDVDSAKAGDYVGSKTKLTKQQARKGVNVYRVTSHAT